MPRDKNIKLTEPKVLLMAVITVKLLSNGRIPLENYEYLLNFFSSADLVEIRKELK